ncbi:hypothetical protein [Haloarcula nitratireducens]|uniref:Uncharacterized protein n=1 Tax=Haloarcula nitratireducens TaxID=2487749 RepID=A0AAW4PKL5_9EURY|nr:hypothetical protein [Halomicroarcula nitratireducens]MBX0298252.1 hypothetical protein [Halomicroarcula nitratireducens]
MLFWQSGRTTGPDRSWWSKWPIGAVIKAGGVVQLTNLNVLARDTVRDTFLDEVILLATPVTPPSAKGVPLLATQITNVNTEISHGRMDGLCVDTLEPHTSGKVEPLGCATMCKFHPDAGDIRRATDVLDTLGYVEDSLDSIIHRDRLRNRGRAGVSVSHFCLRVAHYQSCQ